MQTINSNTLNNCVQTNELWLVLKKYFQTISLQIIYLVCLHEQNLALNKQQRLICHKTQPTNLL